MPKNNKKKAFKALLVRELVLDPELAEEFGLREVLASPEEERDASAVLAALDQGESVQELGLEKPLKKVLKRNRLSAFSKDLAKRLKSAQQDGRAYEKYCQVAVCDAVARAPARAAKSLEKAGDIEDRWARHHHLMGLVQGLRNNLDDAQQHLEEAAENEPFYHGKLRVQQALQYLEDSDRASA